MSYLSRLPIFDIVVYRYVRWNDRHIVIVLPFSESQHYQLQHEHENENLKVGREFADGFNAADIDPGDQRNDQKRDEVVSPSSKPGQVEAEVVRELHRVSSA